MHADRMTTFYKVTGPGGASYNGGSEVRLRTGMTNPRIRDVVAWLAVFGAAAIVEALRRTKPQDAHRYA